MTSPQWTACNKLADNPLTTLYVVKQTLSPQQWTDYLASIKVSQASKIISENLRLIRYAS